MGYKPPRSPDIKKVFPVSFSTVYPPDFSDADTELNLKEIFKRLAGWPEFKPEALSIITGIIRVLFISFTAIRNLAKLFTELLPCLLANLFAYAAERAAFKRYYINKATSGKARFKLFGHDAAHALFKAIQALCEGIHFIGKAMTSPIKGVETAWHFAKTFHQDDDLIESEKISALRISMGILLALTSAAITIAAWSFLLPLIIMGPPALFGLNLAPLIGQAFANTPVMLAVIKSVFSAIFPAFTFAAQGLAAIGALAGSAFLILGTPLSLTMNYFNSNDDPSSNPDPDPAEPVPEIELPIPPKRVSLDPVRQPGFFDRQDILPEEVELEERPSLRISS
jgi:hypothetical protein